MDFIDFLGLVDWFWKSTSTKNQFKNEVGQGRRPGIDFHATLVDLGPQKASQYLLKNCLKTCIKKDAQKDGVLGRLGGRLSILVVSWGGVLGGGTTAGGESGRLGSDSLIEQNQRSQKNSKNPKNSEY